MITPEEFRNDDERRSLLRGALEHPTLREALTLLLVHGPLGRGTAPGMSEATAHVWLGEARGHRQFYFDLLGMAKAPVDRQEPEATYQAGEIAEE